MIVCKRDEISASDLPEYVVSGDSTSLGQSTTIKPLEEVEREYVQFVLALCNGNKSKAAKMLGIDRGTLARKAQSSEETFQSEAEVERRNASAARD